MVLSNGTLFSNKSGSIKERIQTTIGHTLTADWSLPISLYGCAGNAHAYIRQLANAVTNDVESDVTVKIFPVLWLPFLIWIMSAPKKDWNSQSCVSQPLRNNQQARRGIRNSESLVVVFFRLWLLASAQEPLFIPLTTLHCEYSSPRVDSTQFQTIHCYLDCLTRFDVTSVRLHLLPCKEI